MSDLRNRDLRTRDIRKLVSYKNPKLVWDSGTNETSEWVYVSFETEKSTTTFLNWLESKQIKTETRVVMCDIAWSSPKWATWGEIIHKASEIFSGKAFQMYDEDLEWCLEYKPMEIARFGRYQVN